MKPITSLLIMFIVGCALIATGLGVGCTKSSPISPPNLAAMLVTTTIDTDAKCTPYYTDAGETHVHSAECRMPNKSRVYCTLSTDKSPKCETIVDAPKPPAPAPAPAAPTSSSPPAEAPPKAP